MSKQERSVPSYVEYPYEQAILYVHRNASANEMLESVQERLRALLGLLHALERIEVRTGQGVPIQRVAHILVTLGGDALTLLTAAPGYHLLNEEGRNGHGRCALPPDCLDKPQALLCGRPGSIFRMPLSSMP